MGYRVYTGYRVYILRRPTYFSATSAMQDDEKPNLLRASRDRGALEKGGGLECPIGENRPLHEVSGIWEGLGSAT